MNDLNQNFSNYDKEVADKVADEILTVEESDQDRLFFILLLIFLLALLFLVCCSFFGGYRNYLIKDIDNEKYSVKVEIDESLITKEPVTPTPKPTPSDNTSSESGKKEETKKQTKKEEQKEEQKDKEEEEKPVPPKPTPIDPGTILFSYNSGSNYISMHNVYPTSDATGMSLTGTKQYFDFNLSIKYVNKEPGDVTYEISAVPTLNNTLAQKDVRVYLTEDGNPVSANGETVSNFSDLPNSKYQKKGKVLYRKTVTSDYSADYVFRMWLSSTADLTEKSRKFGCKIVVDGYYE